VRDPFRARIPCGAKGRRRVWPALVIKPCDVHSSVVRLAQLPATARAREFLISLRDRCYSLVWAARRARVVPNHVIRFIAGQADCRSVRGVEPRQNRQRRLRDGMSVAVDAKGYASSISEGASATLSLERGSARPLRGGSDNSLRCAVAAARNRKRL
jgi:hypothetical protein